MVQLLKIDFKAVWPWGSTRVTEEGCPHQINFQEWPNGQNQSLSWKLPQNPVLSGLLTVNDVKKSRHHLKMLAGDLYTYEVKSAQSGGSPHCRICCEMKSESISHILTYCSAYSEVRLRIFQEIAYLCMQSKSGVDFAELVKDNKLLYRFILDPTSMNLQRRIGNNDPMLGLFIQKSRDLCFSINELRLKLLKQKRDTLNKWEK